MCYFDLHRRVEVDPVDFPVEYDGVLQFVFNGTSFRLRYILSSLEAVDANGLRIIGACVQVGVQEGIKRK
jgi:hypothetical protein